MGNKNRLLDGANASHNNSHFMQIEKVCPSTLAQMANIFILLGKTSTEVCEVRGMLEKSANSFSEYCPRAETAAVLNMSNCLLLLSEADNMINKNQHELQEAADLLKNNHLPPEQAQNICKRVSQEISDIACGNMRRVMKCLKQYTEFVEAKFVEAYSRLIVSI